MFAIKFLRKMKKSVCIRKKDKFSIFQSLTIIIIIFNFPGTAILNNCKVLLLLPLF